MYGGVKMKEWKTIMEMDFADIFREVGYRDGRFLGEVEVDDVGDWLPWAV